MTQYQLITCVCVYLVCLRRRAANAARAMAALTSSSMSGVFPPIAAAMSMIPSMSSMPPGAKSLSDTSSPADFIDSNENSSSALDQAMAATLAAIEVPELPPKGIYPSFSTVFINSNTFLMKIFLCWFHFPPYYRIANQIQARPIEIDIQRQKRGHRSVQRAAEREKRAVQLELGQLHENHLERSTLRQFQRLEREETSI